VTAIGADLRRHQLHAAASNRRHTHRRRDDEWSKAKRRGVLIDASQNAKGKTIASVYPVRPMPNAPVSTPLHWDEVTEKLDPSIYTIEVARDRLDRHGDLYEGVLKTKQRLGPALRALES
jgi:bifunctional non-homologous end joining protein LigD